MRHEFSAAVKDKLAKRVGLHCSNPACRQPTSGPTLEVNGVINVGVAAHITAAAVGGPRYDATLSLAERKSIRNGIWLCQKCAKQIDSDPIRYSSKILELWRNLAEQVALVELEKLSGAVATFGSSAGEVRAATPRPWVAIDYYSGFDDDEEDFWEKLRIVNRGETAAVSIVVPMIRLAGRSVRLLDTLPTTLGPGESIYAELSGLSATLDRVYRKMPVPAKGPKTLRLPWVIEYRDHDYNRWTTEHAIFTNGCGISLLIIDPNEQQEWTDLSFLGQVRATGARGRASLSQEQLELLKPANPIAPADG